jgi:hypothetical protein
MVEMLVVPLLEKLVEELVEEMIESMNSNFVYLVLVVTMNEQM